MTTTETIIEPARTVPVAADLDVAVVGGGTAGVMAAVGAARAGARTGLVERFAVLGGALSAGIVGHFYNRWRAAGGREVVGGAPREFLARLVAARGTPFAALDEALDHPQIPFRHEYAARVAFEMAGEAGARFWLLAPCCDARLEPGGGYILLIEGKGGRLALRARQVVDCSGEADVAARAGAALTLESTRSWGLLFNLDHVDAPRHAAFLADCPPRCPEFTPWLARRLGKTAAEIQDDWYWKGWLDGDFKAFPFRARIMRAVEDGVLTLLRDLPGGGQIRYGWDGFYPEPWRGPDKAIANVCMITGLDPGRTEDVTRAETAARAYAFEFLDFLRRYIPGFERAEIEAMGALTMARGGRTIAGRQTLAGADIARGAAGPDTVALDVMHPEHPASPVFGLPLGMFVPRGADDLLVAGKCASGGYTVRGTVPCLAAGYSCGILAALAARQGVTPWALDRAAMRQALLAQGVLLDPAPTASAPAPDTEADLRRTLKQLS